MKSFEEARDPAKAHKYKYLRWEPSMINGWGNRFSAVITGLLFGLITDRLVFFDPWLDENPVKSRYDLRWKAQEQYDPLTLLQMIVRI